MDEPSAALTDTELNNLFRVIRGLTAEGVGIIYISHRLEEIFEIGDRVTILRDGKFVQSCPIKETDRRKLVQWMVGRELENEFPRTGDRTAAGHNVILRIEHLNSGILKDIDLSIEKGEIVGFAGLVGAGRTELAVSFSVRIRKKAGKFFSMEATSRPKAPARRSIWGSAC